MPWSTPFDEPIALLGRKLADAANTPPINHEAAEGRPSHATVAGRGRDFDQCRGDRRRMDDVRRIAMMRARNVNETLIGLLQPPQPPKNN